MYLIQERKAFLLVGAAMALVLAAGCATMAPIYSVSGQPIATNKPASMDEIGKAIVVAGTSIRMQMKQVSPGVILATYISTKQRMAIMEIKYDTKQYSITYKDSQNLNYDGQQILGGYNGWVQNLDKAILAQLKAL